MLSAWERTKQEREAISFAPQKDYRVRSAVEKTKKRETMIIATIDCCVTAFRCDLENNEKLINSFPSSPRVFPQQAIPIPLGKTTTSKVTATTSSTLTSSRMNWNQVPSRRSQVQGGTKRNRNRRNGRTKETTSHTTAARGRKQPRWKRRN